MKMKRFLSTGILLLSLVLSAVTVQANEVNMYMSAITMSYARFNAAQTVADASKALASMRTAAVAARAQKPYGLTNAAANNPKLRVYQSEMDKLIAEIDKTSKLVKAGKMAQAKTEGKKILQLRDEGHAAMKH
ncbi:cytochrome b562 [Snodgrassella gandavensis]|uniref:cytochrome b562 n=1 Tax=Snodgrassella gandavensis TaxID=2946698 RepID=UPI001EF54690|nr:cytochrome b562 [Snodgrassella gandavensis]